MSFIRATGSCCVLTLVICGFTCAAISAAAEEEMRVRDLFIPADASDVTFVKRRGDVRFQVDSDFKTVGSDYAKKLAEQGWSKSGKDNLQRNFWVQHFAKDNLKLEVRVDSRDDGCEVRLTPNGLMWDEDSQPSPKDLPLPEDAKDIEYDDFFESIEFHSPSNVKTIVDFFTTELGNRNWTKDQTEFDLEDFSRLKFTQGTSSLAIDIRGEDMGSEVEITTKGMQWDGIEAENERAEEAAEQAAEQAAHDPPQHANPDQPLELPARKQKAKQGIENLPKLPNEGTVEMDGTSFKLTSVIAYETYEDGQWLTKILATRNPIKQEILLASLKKQGTDKDKDGNPLTWPQPYLQITLDEDDQPSRLSLQAADTPGSGSGDELAGTALVEDGRARGTVQLKEPGSFFDKVYTAEISFDVAVLTRESTSKLRYLAFLRLH